MTEDSVVTTTPDSVLVVRIGTSATGIGLADPVTRRGRFGYYVHFEIERFCITTMARD